MTTLIRNLPQFSTGAFTVSNNAAWLDTIYFGAPGYPVPITISGCSSVLSSSTVTVPILISTIGVSVGMQVLGLPINVTPPSIFIGSIPSATTFTVIDTFGNALFSPVTNAELALTFQPPPLDLTGIGFVANLRAVAGGTQVFLVAQTGNGTLVNSGKLGTLTFNVPRTMMNAVPAGSYVMDILAADATTVVNLFQVPATVTVLAGIADITTLTGMIHP